MTRLLGLGLIARDTMHQQQWLAVIEDLGGIAKTLPIPNSTPTEHKASEHAYYFLNTSQLAAIQSALAGGMSKAAACRTFGVKRTTLIEALRRTG